MAGDWIKMRSDLFTHPKVVRMASALKADKLRTVGGLMSVWCLFDAHSIDGELEGYTFDEVDDHLRWPGFSAAMCAIGWLSETGKGLSLPEFDTHNGQSAKRRAQDADRKREVRKVSASDADEKRTREEKRREEKSNSVPNGTGAVAPLKSADDMTKDELWSAGKSLLMAADMPKAQCGSFVGKLVKDYGDTVVVDAVRAAVVARPVDPAEYLKATCQRMAGQRLTLGKQEALEARNMAVAGSWLPPELRQQEGAI
jgi:hypothetical protein